MINKDPQLLNLTEHDLYLPHNMHMMVSGTFDMMCSPDFDARELGRVREVLWRAQCMGRIGNLVSTWERELRDRDFTSGVFSYAIRIGAVTADRLAKGPIDETRDAIKNGKCEEHFIEQWREHRDLLLGFGESIRSVDVPLLAAGLETLFEIHMASRGLK